MLRVLVLLEGEHLPQSQISGRLQQVSLKNNLCLAPSIIPSILTSFPVPADEKHPHTMMLPLPCFTDVVLGVVRGVRFVPDIVFFLLAKKLNFSLI